MKYFPFRSLFLVQSELELSIIRRYINKFGGVIEVIKIRSDLYEVWLEPHDNSEHIMRGVRRWTSTFEHARILADMYISIKALKSQPSEDFKPSVLIDTFVSPGRATDMQANLAEVFPIWVERHGLAAAHRIRKVQIARLIIGEYWNKAIELIKAVKLAGS